MAGNDAANTERGYTIVRLFDAPPEVIWDAWTTPEHFAAWFGTERFPMSDVELDVRPQGTWHGTMTLSTGSTKLWNGIYLEVDPPTRLVMSISNQEIIEGGYELFTVTLVAKGDQTEMTLRQSGGHLSDEEYERARVGTDSFMDTLAGLLPGIPKARHDTA